MKENRAEEWWNASVLMERINSLKDGWSVCAVHEYKTGVQPKWLLVLERDV